MDIGRPMGWISASSRLLAAAALLAATVSIAAQNPPAKPVAAASGGTVSRAGTVDKAGTVAQPATAGSKAKPAAANGGRKTPPPKTKPKQKPGEVMELDWRDLLPENERAHFSAVAPPPQHGPLGEGGPPAVQKESTTFNEELGDMVVRMPGFVVPIGTPHNGLITEFFLVPYIGACIHVPPPPPNQMVYVKSANGIAADAVHEAYWVTGKMRIENRTTPLGTAAYAITASKVDLYAY